MELTDSTRPTQTLIDLNDSPPSQSPRNLDALSVVRSFHETLAPPPPANPPNAPAVSTCSACALPAENVLVCDGCELGFHIGCAEMPGKKEAVLGEWRCGKCVKNAVPCKGWPLGVKAEAKVYRRRNPGKAALRPPRVCADDGEGEALSGSREHSVGDTSLGGNPFGVSVTYPKLSSAGNRSGFRKASGIMSQSVKSGSEDQFQNKESQIQNIKEFDRCALSEGLKSESEDLFQHKESEIQSIKEFDSSLSEGLKSGSEDLFQRKESQIPNIKDFDGYANSKGIKKRRLSSTNMSPEKTSKMYLESLREYIRESCGSILKEGWRVEFRNSMDQEELNIVYCAPDEKTCESMSEVASYLGISPNVNGVKDIPKRRKSARLYVANGVAAKKESVVRDFVKDQLSDIQPVNSVGESISGIEELNDEFPVQYEDFFILSPGIIDARPSYHIADQIWPTGYKSCWHDKVTGSLFICDVLDGGDSGPVFTIKRSSCSALPIPIGSTVLCEPNADEPDVQKEGNSFSGNYSDEDLSILGMLSESSPPKGLETLSCFGGTTFDCSSGEASNGLLLEANSHDEKSKNIRSNKWADGIGEFAVEEFSSSLAWRMMSQKLTSACREAYMQTGHLEFCCKHAADATGSFYLDGTKQKFDEKDGPLVKFCGSLKFVNIPAAIHDRRELEILSETLFRWLDKDRFGLDTEFVQEILEQLPGATSCPFYVFLKKRTAYSSSLTVGNGSLVAKTNDGVDPTNEKPSDDSSELCQQAKIQKFEYSLIDNHLISLGKPISSALPPQLLNDALQVWEYLCRFHDVLELSEPYSFEELEKELISPWFDSSDLEKFLRKPQECLDTTLQTDGTSCRNLSPNIESGPAVPEEYPHAFIHMDTGKAKEAAEAKLASVTYSRCNGFALTKIHKSLIRVLVGELQSKVAAVINPKFDTGESKSKRGRKKDANYWIASIRSKINILPLNELTWPELVRRYILAVLSMDGRLDSADTISLESGKVFRCLQGDGGVLCGSLTGVAGIEADTLLLAEATQNIFGSLNNEHDTLAIDDVDSNDSIDKKLVLEGVATPEWAKVLEPVRKLPTNVGARIRKCVYEALEKDPPEWAKKVLEHSISKGVYKGNASGPTKKAVLSVLADLSTPGLLQKPDKEQKKQKLLSISDIVMKRCRAVLRHLAVADTTKNFCNMLGRKFSDCSDSDDEGLLGSPTILSRPLDFRTIDLKLATGAYGGSHEAFREDVREFWTNVRIAYKDQPDFIQLAEMLAHNFESMYEKEVLTLFLKLVKYSKSKFLSAHSKDEIDQLLVSACEIPKAPWEGVCKVCGFDRDDDNVLLCDKCDAEYHKYCLNPPLARIPEGNWYCPSCVAGKHVVQEESDTRSIFGCHKRCRGEFTRLHLDSLAQIALVMEEREYWELGVVERTFLLKFLFEELLSSVLIRQHLEQCAEPSTDLLQKLRFLSLELKTLKYKEESLGAKTTDVDKSFEHCQTRAEADKLKDHTTVSENRHGNSRVVNPMVVEGQLEDNQTVVCDSHFVKPMVVVGRPENNQGIVCDSQNHGNSFIHTTCNDDLMRWKDMSSSKTIHQGVKDLDIKAFSDGSLENHLECDIPALATSENLQGLSVPVTRSSNAGVNDPAVDVIGSQSTSLDLIRNEILHLQNSIASSKSQLLKQSVRREFLGCDSFSRFYWVLADTGTYPSVISKRNTELKKSGTIVSFGFLDSLSVLRADAFGSVNASKSSSAIPCLYALGDENVHSTCVSYQSDAEIKNLVDRLQDNNPTERELKESILRWRKLIFQGSQQSTSQHSEGPQLASPSSRDSEISFSFRCLNTVATNLLESKHDTYFEAEMADFTKRRLRKGKGLAEVNFYRCECLELIWQSRHHCLSCHKTFFNIVELDGHSDGKCNLAAPVLEKIKESNDTSKGKNMMQSEIGQVRCRDEIYAVDASTNGLSQLPSKLIRHQNDGSVCPFDYEDICSKFVIKDSNKELVKQIGLIGSNGIPTFVPSIFPYLSDSRLMLVPLQKTEGIQNDTPKTGEQIVFPLEKMLIGGHNVKDKSAAHCCAPLNKFGNIVPEPSLRPLAGKSVYVLQQLKINLLDMDAALPEEALRPSKRNSDRRCAWRKFVKSAERIYEMVQATIAFEDMIKSQCLKNSWWYWSSLSAAARISTLSSLALRIYSLDAAINYDKSYSHDALLSIGRDDQKQQSSSDQSEKCKVGRKSNKKRKDRES